MRIAVLSIIFFLCINSINAQESFIGNINYPLLEKYVELAKQNYPKRKMYKASELSAKAKIGVAKATYLDAFTASYYYRPNNSTTIDVNNPFIVNGWSNILQIIGSFPGFQNFNYFFFLYI